MNVRQSGWIEFEIIAGCPTRGAPPGGLWVKMRARGGQGESCRPLGGIRPSRSIRVTGRDGYGRGGVLENHGLGWSEWGTPVKKRRRVGHGAGRVRPAAQRGQRANQGGAHDVYRLAEDPSGEPRTPWANLACPLADDEQAPKGDTRLAHGKNTSKTSEPARPPSAWKKPGGFTVPCLDR